MTRLETVGRALTLNSKSMTFNDRTPSPRGGVCAVGIDVSSARLSICLKREDRTKEFLEVRNTEAEIARLLRRDIPGYGGKIVLESTGRHHLLSAVKLSEQGFDARVINPLLFRKYSSSAVRKVKSDRQDAAVLAEIALKEEKLPERFSLTRQNIEIRKQIALLGALEKETQRLSAIMSDYEKTKESLGLKLTKPEKAVRRIADAVTRVQAELEKAVIAAARKEPAVAARVERYRTIPGVSEYMATMASIAFDPAAGAEAKQWVAFAGLDVSVRESGVWKGRGKLTKRGNPYLRKRLFSAAWGATMNDPRFKAYYRGLRESGRTYTEALVITARKIVRIMFSLEKNKAEYDSRTFN
jgi:transposase